MMAPTFFAKLRARQQIRKIEKELCDFQDRAPVWAEARTKVRWLDAQLAIAIENDDHTAAARLMPLCQLADAAFKKILALEDAENKRVERIAEDPKEV
jgi:hypothetical protein